MSTIAVGASQTFNLGDGQTLEIATNGGFYSLSLTPNLTGKTTTSVQGPGAHAHTFGPYAGGAVLILGNQTVDTFTVVQPPATLTAAQGAAITAAGTTLAGAIALDSAGNMYSPSGLTYRGTGGNGASIVLFGDSETELNRYIGALGLVLTQSGGVATIGGTGVSSFNQQVVRISRTGADAFSGGYNGDHRVTVPGSGQFDTFAVDPSLPATAPITPPFTSPIVQYKTCAADRGWFELANARLGQAFTNLSVSAFGGAQTSHLLAMINDPVFGVFPYKPRFVTLFIGINDILQGVSTPTIIANLNSLVTQLRSAGIEVFLFTLMPLESGHANYNSTTEKAIFDVNRWVKQRARSTDGVYLVDAFQAIVDTASSPAAAISGYLAAADHIHLTPVGARAVGDAFFAVASKLNLTPNNTLVAHGNDSYAVNSASSQLITNPLMTGTGGTISAGTSSTMTGTVASNWTSAWSGNAAGGCTHSIVARTVANDGDAIGNNQKLAVTFAASGDQIDFRQTVEFHARVTAGDDVYFESAIRWDSAVNLKGIEMTIALTDGVSAINCTSWGYYTGAGATWSTADSGIMVIRTPPMKVPPGVTAAQARFYIKSAGAGGVNVYIGRPDVSKGSFGA